MEELNKLNQTFLSASPKEVREGKMWYVTARQQIRREANKLGLPFIQVAGVVAAFSPRKSWQTNIRHAITWLNTGRILTTYSNINKAERILLTKDVNEIIEILNGPKITRFFLNLYSRRYKVVTIDSHAWDALGWDHLRMNKTTLAKAREEYHRQALKVGLKPYQYQAIVWLSHKRLKKNKLRGTYD